MGVFPATSVTLLHKLAVEATGERDVAWGRFFDLYVPAIRKFAEWHGGGSDAEDLVQEVLLKLVGILQSGGYSAANGNFRAFLATLIRRQVVDLYRRGQARGDGRTVPLEDLELSVPPEQAEQIDLKWRLARHEAAVEHVLTRTALSEQSRAVYRAHVLEGLPAKEVAARFGISANLVGQIKFRVGRAVETLEAELADG